MPVSPKRTTTLKFSAQSFVPQYDNTFPFTDAYSVNFSKDKIQEGTKSNIYKCIHKETGTERAVKVIEKSTWNDDMNNAIRKEFEFLKIMDHQNIAKVYESFESETHFYIVTEYCKGGELRDVLFLGSGFSEYYTALLIKTILATINYVYTKHSVIHLGLKPENILLPANRNTEHLMLIDFNNSIVSPKGKSITDPKTRKLNRLIGTPAYLSPESLHYQSYSHKADCWAVGVLAYQALAGFLPFEGADDRETLELIVNSKTEIETKGLFDHPVWEGVSDEAISFISELLSYEQWKRPTAKVALQHPWMRYVTEAQAEVVQRRDAVMAFEAMSNIIEFSAPTKLQQAALTYIATVLIDKDDKQSVDSIFQMMDISDSGKLSLSDLQNGFQRLFGEDLPEDVAEDLFLKMDFNGSGFVEYSEFAVAAMNKDILLTEDNLQIAFHMFDKDGSGSITMSDMKAVLELYMENHSDHLEEYIVGKIVQEDVSYDDFVAMLQEAKMSLSDEGQDDSTAKKVSSLPVEASATKPEHLSNRALYEAGKAVFEGNIRRNQEMGMDSTVFQVGKTEKGNPKRTSFLGLQVPISA